MQSESTYRFLSIKKNPGELLRGYNLEATPRVELGIKDLQSSALPLGYVARKNYRRENVSNQKMKTCTDLQSLPQYAVWRRHPESNWG